MTLCTLLMEREKEVKRAPDGGGEGLNDLCTAPEG